MQGGYLSLLYSTSDKPLEYWSKQKSKTGSIQRVFDKELNERVLEIQDLEDANFQKTWIMCPPNTNQILDIKLPILAIILKSLQSQLLIQVQLIDKNNIRHLINFSNLEPRKKNTESKIGPLRMHLILEPGWNKLEIDFNHLCKLFDAQFNAVCRLKICSNCRIRRIYFIDKHYSDDEISLVLYQGFFDFYMSKWGIKKVERMTQTKKTMSKPLKEHFIMPTSSLNKLFLKNLQAKSDEILDEYLSKQSIISMKNYLDFKKKAKIKPYVIPENNKFKYKRTSSSSLVDLNEIRRNFCNNNLYDKLTFEENNEKKTEQEKDKQEIKNLIYKVHRYNYPQASEKNFNLVKNTVKKPIYSASKK